MAKKGILRKELRIALTFAVGREKCTCCGKETFDMPLCRNCIESHMLNFVPPGDGRCTRCGKVLLSENGTCTACRTKPVIETPDSVFPLYSYRLWHKKLLSEWKLHGRRSLSAMFASLIAKALSSLNLMPENSFVVPVPPRPGKIRREGWDQIMELASILRSDYGYPVLQLLKRLSVTQQKEKNRRQRLEGNNSSYMAAEDACEMIKKAGAGEKNAVLIDDVITTGVTVEECSKHLKGLGIRKVHVLSIFIVD
ncbi:MAG: ComF family protein [Treponema sp.]|nr:ComF family protein [Treponema sp.]